MTWAKELNIKDRSFSRDRGKGAANLCYFLRLPDRTWKNGFFTTCPILFDSFKLVSKTTIWPELIRTNYCATLGPLNSVTLTLSACRTPVFQKPNGHVLPCTLGNEICPWSGAALHSFELEIRDM